MGMPSPRAAWRPEWDGACMVVVEEAMSKVIAWQTKDERADEGFNLRPSRSEHLPACCPDQVSLWSRDQQDGRT